jgi:hypothetical protein
MQKGGTLGTHCQSRPIGTAIACEVEHGHRDELADKPRCTIWDGTAERVAGPAAAHQGLLEEIWKLPRHRGGAPGGVPPWSVGAWWQTRRPDTALPNLH